MKKALFLLASLLVASCAHMPKTASQLNDYFKSAVLIRFDVASPAEDGVRGWSGSGFSIASSVSGDEAGSTILTNKHICAMGDAGRYTLTDYTGKRYSASFVRYAPEADLCVLKTDAIIEPVKLADHDPKRAEHVIVVGAPHGQFPNFTDGWVSGYCPVDISLQDEAPGVSDVHVVAICMSAPIYPGNSGSEVMNDSGEVVGIAFAGSGNAEHMTAMVGVDEIRKFLDTSNNIYFR